MSGRTHLDHVGEQDNRSAITGRTSRMTHSPAYEDRQQRLTAAALTGAWVLALVLAWLLLPLLLHPDGALLVLWYAAGWVLTAVLGLLPYVVGTTFGSRS